MSGPSLLRALRPEVQAELYDFYDTLRSTDELYWDRTVRAWVATSYDVVSEAAGDSRLSSERYPDLAAVPEELRPAARVLGKQMLYSDAPDHPRLRGLVSKAFTPKAVEQLRERIIATVDGLIAAARPAGHMDVIAELAYPLPMTVICDLLEVPESDRARLKTWSADIAMIVGNTPRSPAENRAAVGSTEQLVEYFRWLVAHQPGGLLRSLLRDSVDGAHLSEEELLANCVLLLTAGHETTTNFIGNGLLALLQHPQQLRRLADHPSLVRPAVDELLRFDSPVHFMFRRARDDLSLAGRDIAKGEAVLLVCGAANRDPTAFPDPHALDFDRSGPRYLSFGHGPHFCLGAGLARLEGEIALLALITQLPGLRLAHHRLQWQRNLNLRGLTRLDVRFD